MADGTRADESGEGQAPGTDLRELPLSRFRPRSELRVPEHPTPNPRFPVIDAHNHLGPEFGGRWHGAEPAELVAVLDEAGVELMVDLDGGWGDALTNRIAAYEGRFPGRFVHFARVDWETALAAPDPGAYMAEQLRDGVRRGARGLKVWKDLGLQFRDSSGALAPVDDARFAPLWEAVAEAGVPVLIHTGDPAAFFRPLDETNERLEELARRPEWHFYPDFPSLDELFGQLERLVLRHPNTTFIGAHAGCYPEDLGRVGALMERAPNWHIDISARVAELGRQPRMTRRLIERFPDRVLFGTDTCGAPELNAVYYRFLETEDEHFAYNPGRNPYPQGRWRISGIGLPDDLLRMVYRDNARRVLGLE